jgi:hypothetical protein
MICHSRQQIEAQTKAFAPITITLTQDAKHFEPCQSVFDNHASARQLPILMFLLACEGMMFAFLVRRLTIGVPTVQAPISRIGQAATLSTQPQAAFLEQRKVVRVSSTKGRGQNTPTVLFDHHLRFQRVPFLFATEEGFAFFCAPLPSPLPCGCSITHSVASTTTTCQTVSLGRRAFLPGKVNWPERIKASSTRRTVREAVASLKPYAQPMWKRVRYSRQYISVKSNWSHKGSLGGRPKTRTCSLRAASIASKVSRRTPVSRKNSSGLRFLMSL